MHISERKDGYAKKKRKKEKVVSLRMSEDSFDTIEEYASRQGLSVNAYINSIVDSYAEWHIPGISLERVAVPKKLLATLFNAADKNTMDKLGQFWAHEAKNVIFLSGSEFSLESAIDYVKKASKYFVHTSPTITLVKSGTDVSEVNHDSDREGKDLDDNDILMAVRHDMGNNFSIFVSQFLLHFFRQLESRKVTEDHDSTTNLVKLEKLR